MEKESINNPDLHRLGTLIEIIGNDAVIHAQLENKKRKIPTVYSIDGKIYYELPDGKITTESPFLN